MNLIFSVDIHSTFPVLKNWWHQFLSVNSRYNEEVESSVSQSINNSIWRQPLDSPSSYHSKGPVILKYLISFSVLVPKLYSFKVCFFSLQFLQKRKYYSIVPQSLCKWLIIKTIPLIIHLRSLHTLLAGRGNNSSLSNLPGRRRAGSMASTLLVAPITTISPRSSSPSISASRVDTILAWIWSCFADRTGASPSNSSKKIIDGLAWCAYKQWYLIIH